MRPGRALAGLAGWLLASAALAGALLRGWVGDAWMVTRYTGYVMPWLLVALVPGAAWAWHARRRVLSAALAAAALAVAARQVPLLAPRRPPPSPEGALVLRVMSFNTSFHNADVPRLAGVVRGYAPDLLLLQEISPEVFAALVAALRADGGGVWADAVYEPGIEQGVVSRWPLEGSTALPARGKAQRVLVRTPGEPITVFNVHPLRSNGWRYRYRQIAALLDEEVARVDGPVIVAGDFNTPDHSELYALLSRRLRNAHREAGAGFGFTYPSADFRLLGALPLPVPALVRIDHVFLGGGLVALRAATLPDAGGSDHRPVVAELALVPAARRAACPYHAAASKRPSATECVGQ